MSTTPKAFRFPNIILPEFAQPTKKRPPEVLRCPRCDEEIALFHAGNGICVLCDIEVDLDTGRIIVAEVHR
jgi:hypothetical protein